MPSAPPSEDLQEQLARFREEWKAEVQRTKAPSSPTQDKVKVTLKSDDLTLRSVRSRICPDIDNENAIVMEDTGIQGLASVSH